MSRCAKLNMEVLDFLLHLPLLPLLPAPLPPLRLVLLVLLLPLLLQPMVPPDQGLTRSS